MKKFALLAIVPAALALTAGAALAQSTPAPTPAATTAAQPRFSVETTPLETLEAHAEAKALVIKHLGAIFDHTAYPMIKSMPLKAIQPYSQGAITDEKLAALQAELAALE